MEKAYEKIVFVNDQAPDLDADNLNSISDAIDTIDDRVVEQDALIDGLDTRVSTNTTNISTNTADIADLKSNTGFEISSASPLHGCSASSIVGIDVDGCSTQGTTSNLASGNVTTTSDAVNIPLSSGKYRVSANGTLADGNWYVGAWNSSGSAITPSAITVDGMTLNGTSTWYYGKSSAQSFEFTLSTACNVRIGKQNATNTIPLVVVGITPTPTNPIAIVDASGDVIAHTVNLFDYSSTEVGGINVDGTENTSTTNRRSGYIPITVPFTVSNKDASWGASGYRVTLYDKNKTFINTYRQTSVPFTISSETNAYYVRINSSTLDAYVQIELGTTATDYVAYASNKITLPTLRSCGNVKDELIVNSDGGSKNVLVGKKTISVSLTANQVSYIAFEQMSNAYGRIALMCDKFEAKLGGSNTIYMASDYARLVITSATDFSGDITVYYPLATPTTTTLTASEVSAIRQLQTYSGTTIVDSALDVKSVTYHAGVKEYIDWRFEQLATLMLGEE